MRPKALNLQEDPRLLGRIRSTMAFYDCMYILFYGTFGQGPSQLGRNMYAKHCLCSTGWLKLGEPSR